MYAESQFWVFTFGPESFSDVHLFLFALLLFLIALYLLFCLRRQFLFAEVDLDGVKKTSLSGDGEGDCSWKSSSSLG